MTAESVDAAALNVARLVKAHREARGWSLGALAQRTGLSKALLSRLEAEGGNPSLETLWRLARAFDVPLGTLLGEGDPPPIRIIRAQEGAVLTSESGLEARLVLADGREHRTEIYEAHLRAGVAYTSQHPPGAEELVYCLEGVVEAGPEGEVELAPGDALWFAADRTHRYFAPDGGRVLSIMSYPPAVRRGAPRKRRHA